MACIDDRLGNVAPKKVTLVDILPEESQKTLPSTAKIKKAAFPPQRIPGFGRGLLNQRVEDEYFPQCFLVR